MKEARFPEGKSVDVPKYLEEHGNPEAAEKWKEMNEEYGDLLKTATGEADSEWVKWLEKEMKTLASRSGGLVQLLEVRAFDQYQGPYARIRVKNLGVFKVWTLDEGFYIPDFPVVNTSSSENPGYKADDLFDLRDGIKQAVKESMGKKASISPKTRAGTRVVVNGNPGSRILYGRHDLPPDGTMGTVTLMALPGGKRTYLPGPGGGLIYVDFDNGVTMGVAPQDLDLATVRKAGQELLPRSISSKIPKLYSQEMVADPIVWVKFFNPYGRGVWLITEFDGRNTMFGLADLGFPGLGYISLSELSSLTKFGAPMIERDLHFHPMPLSEAIKKEHINYRMTTFNKQASRPLYEIAREIRKDWGSKVNYAAKPYLEAMQDLDKISDMYGQDKGTSIVAYFLSNASSWKGDKAKEIKAELKAMLKSGGKSAMSELEKMSRLEDEGIQEMEQMLADYEEGGTNTDGDDRHPELDEGSLIPGIQERLAFEDPTSTLHSSFEKIHGFFWGLYWMSPEQEGPDPKDYKDIEKAYKILVVALKDPIAGGLVKHYLRTYDHLGGAYTNASMPPTGVTIKQKTTIDATPLKAAGWAITETSMGRVVWGHPETDVTFMTSAAERAVVVSLGATRILKQPPSIQGIERMASKHIAALEALAGNPADDKFSRFEEGVSADPTKNMSPEDKAKWHKQKEEHKDEFKKEAARWMKRHEQAIDKWLATHPNYRGPDDWDSMPSDLTRALERINDYESLWSDAQRYFGDQLHKQSMASRWASHVVFADDEHGETFAFELPPMEALVHMASVEKTAFSQTDEDFVEWAINQPPMNKAQTIAALKRAGVGDILPPKEKPQGPRFQEGDEVLISASKHKNPVTADIYNEHDKKLGTVVATDSNGATVQFKSGTPVHFPDAQSRKGVGIYKWIKPFDMQGSKKLEIIYESGKPAKADRIVVVEQYLNRGKSEPRKVPYFTGHVFTARFNKSGGVYFTMLPQQRLHVDPRGQSTEAGFDATSINPEVGNLYYLGIFGKRPQGWETDLESMRQNARVASSEIPGEDNKLSRFEEGKPADPTKNMSPEDAKKWKQQNEAHRNEFKTAIYTEDEFGETFAIGITASVAHQASGKVAFNQTDSDFVEWAINQPPMTKTETVMTLKKAGIKNILPPREKRQGPRFQEGDEVLISASKHTDSMTKDVYDEYDKKVGKVVGLEDLGVYVQFKSGQPVFFPDAQKPRGVGIYKWIAPFDMQGSSKLEAIYESGKPSKADRIIVVQQYLNRGKSEPRKAPYFTGHAFNARFNKSGGVYFTMLPQQRLHVDPRGQSTEAGFDATSINPEVGNLYYLGIFGKRPAKWEMELESMRSQARAIAASTSKTAGYTNHWNVSRDFTDAEWAEITTKVKQIIAKAAMTKTLPGDVIMVSDEVEAYVAEHGIQVAGPRGTGSPMVTKKVIAFNGVTVLDQDHESFVLYKSAKENGGYGFCKTARKPYDAVVASILWWVQKIAPDAIEVRRDGGGVNQVLARNPSDDKLSRFEEGKPADPTKNMSPEDKAKWGKQKEEHKDEFKAAYTSYKGDPFWMKAKFPGKAKDGTPFKRGEDILYWPRTKTIMVGKKAEQEWREFQSHAEDEDAYMSQYPSDRYAKEAAQAPTGLYGFTRRVQADCETCARKLTKQAKTIAKRIYAKDEQVAPFLATHAKKGRSLSAKVLMAAMQDLGPKFAKQAGFEGHHHFEGGRWYVDSNFINAVQHVYPDAELVHMGMGEFYLETPDGRLDFDRMRGVDFEGQVGRSHRLYDDAQGKVIDKAIKLMDQRNKSVKVASEDDKEADFPHYWLGKLHRDFNIPVTPEEVIPEEIAKTAAARTYGLYGFGSKTANLGITACAELREAAGILASDLHHRRADSHEHLTGFLKQHAKEAGCIYSKMLHEAYPDAAMKLASQDKDWITWEE